MLCIDIKNILGTWRRGILYLTSSYLQESEDVHSFTFVSPKSEIIFASRNKREGYPPYHK